MATVFSSPDELLGAVGADLGSSDWVQIDQERINLFADATGDHQWIHVDVERASRELPSKGTIAHGYLTLSLLPRMMGDILEIRRRTHGINYGCNKVRFTGVVPAGSRVRLRQTLQAAEDVTNNGVRLISACTIEIEGAERPALVAETIGLAYG